MEQPPESWRSIETPEPEPAAREARPERPRLALALGAAAAALLALAVGLAATSSGGLEPPETRPAVAASHVSEGPARASGAITVDVAGAVARPGVYALPAGCRVADAIRAAGGYSARVDTAAVAASLNLAEPLADGAKLVVPERGAAAAPAGTAGRTGTATGGRIDINRASASELDTLPGIGPVTAAKIIAAREEQRFRTVDELVTRKVVSASVFGKIRDLVTAGGG